VARSNDDQHHEDNERKKCNGPQVRITNQSIDYEVWMKLLEKGNYKPRRIHAACLHGNECDRDQNAGKNLQSELRLSCEPEVSFVNDFGVVVGESNGGECGG